MIKTSFQSDRIKNIKDYDAHPKLLELWPDTTQTLFRQVDCPGYVPKS